MISNEPESAVRFVIPYAFVVGFELLPVFGVHPVPLTFVIANVLFALTLSLSSSNEILSFPTLTVTEPLVNTNEPLATNPLESAGSDALSFVRVADNPSNIFTGLILTESENWLPNWSEPEI